MRRDKFTRFLDISKASKTASEFHSDTQLANRGTLQGSDVRSLVEHRLDLVRSATALFADTGFDPK
ncbi:MAG: hypothetical protein E5W01_17940, partial [Mesorhizobium sp.]